MAMCDGSVHIVAFEIDPISHSAFMNWSDGKLVDDLH